MGTTTDGAPSGSGADAARNSRPVITVVTPSFNQGPFLERTMQSVLDQGYPRLEYIVMDGGSTDDSVAIIERYADRLAYWTSGKDGGQGNAVNAGWRRATGEILGWLNSDDLYAPGTLDFVADYFATHPDTLLVYGVTEYVDEEQRPLGRFGAPFDWRPAVLGDYMIAQPSAFIRRSALDRVGYLDESLYFAMDMDFFLRVAALRPPDFVDRVLSSWVVHADAKTSRGRAAARQEGFKVGARYAHGVTRLLIPLYALRSRIFHAMPKQLKRRIDVIRDIGPSAG